MFKRLSTALLAITIVTVVLARTASAGPTTFTTPNGKCLDVMNGYIGVVGMPLQTYTCNGTAAQSFYIGSGRIAPWANIANVLTRTNANEGYVTKLYPSYYGLASQRWNFLGATVWSGNRDLLLRVPAPGYGQPIPTGFSYPYSGVAYVSQTAYGQLRLNDGRCLEVRSTANGTRVVATYCSASSVLQRWNINYRGIVSVYANKCLALPPYTSSNYAEIRDCSPQKSLTLWASVQANDGSNRCLTTAGTNPWDWAPVTTQPCDWSVPQSWKFQVGDY